MRRLVVLVAMFALIMGCRSFEVVVKQDPFKGSTTVTADMWHSVSEGNLDNMRALYTKDIKNGVVLPPELMLEFSGLIGTYTGYQGEKLEKLAYLSADSKSFKVYFQNVTQKEFKDTSTSSHSSSSLSHSGLNSSSRTSTRTWHTSHMTGVIKLTPDIQKAILDANNYMIRVYTGKTPTTLTATPDQLKALKTFLKADATYTNKK